MSFADPNRRADGCQIEELDDGGIFHADAAVARGAADACFVIGAVDVDVAVKGVGIVRLRAMQPKDAGEHEITLSLHAGLPLAHGLT